MKNASVALNVVLLIAVGVLYFLFFKEKKAATGPVVSGVKDNSTLNLPTKIGYFDMDSVENRYTKIKEVRDLLKEKEQAMSGEMNGLKKKYMDRIQQLQAKAQTMSQQEGEAAQAEINQMQEQIRAKESELTQALQGEQFKMMQDINKRIEEFLKIYNQKKNFAYILSHQPGDFIYFKDSLCNVTSDLVEGLNAAAASEKKK
ncbi:MAG: OmpH family outer membrane protein [Bacteroidota bacterium]